CLNGIEAMPEGGVLSLRGRKKKLRPLAPRRQSEQALQPPLDYVQVEIADSGPGIPENDLKKIFNPFYTTKTEGAGLGLSICSRLVEENNGKIDVVSHKDQGTKFILALPTFASR
ncbi:MAG: PAS domain-containing sensor histidine kinase, partial [Calditrichaeota bacterium]|nr:PAS domain-containing sensor histidine kinase [Calditrichota bacterium]